MVAGRAAALRSHEKSTPMRSVSKLAILRVTKPRGPVARSSISVRV